MLLRITPAWRRWLRYPPLRTKEVGGRYQYWHFFAVEGDRRPQILPVRLAEAGWELDEEYLRKGLRQHG